VYGARDGLGLSWGSSGPVFFHLFPFCFLFPFPTVLAGARKAARGGLKMEKLGSHRMRSERAPMRSDLAGRCRFFCFFLFFFVFSFFFAFFFFVFSKVLSPQ
jgi:hypothetical protein